MRAWMYAKTIEISVFEHISLVWNAHEGPHVFLLLFDGQTSFDVVLLPALNRMCAPTWTWNAAASQSSVTSNLLVTMSIENKTATARKIQQPCERVYQCEWKQWKKACKICVENEKKIEAIIFLFSSGFDSLIFFSCDMHAIENNAQVLRPTTENNFNHFMEGPRRWIG